MRKNTVVSLRIPTHLDELAALRAETEHTDKATALRQWLHEGALQLVLRWVSEGRISMTRGAELLEMSALELYDHAARSELEFGATSAQGEISRANAARSVEELKATKARG